MLRTILKPLVFKAIQTILKLSGPLRSHPDSFKALEQEIAVSMPLAWLVLSFHGCAVSAWCTDPTVLCMSVYMRIVQEMHITCECSKICTRMNMLSGWGAAAVHEQMITDEECRQSSTHTLSTCSVSHIHVYIHSAFVWCTHCCRSSH